MFNAMHCNCDVIMKWWQESLLYAQDREQGGRPIVEHDDVKRMLLLQKAYSEVMTTAFVSSSVSTLAPLCDVYDGCDHSPPPLDSEGSFALCLHAASLHDRATGGDKKAAALLDVLTEVRCAAGGWVCAGTCAGTCAGRDRARWCGAW